MVTGSTESGVLRVSIDTDMRVDTREAIHLEELTQATPQSALTAARELLLEYGRFVLAQPGAGRFCFGTLEQEAAGLPASFLNQGGGSLLASAHGEPAGFVAWRAMAANDVLASESWELKRLWVRPAGRGLGLGRMLTQAVLDRAAAQGRKAIYLDTAPASMGNAYRLYLEMGFTPCDRYNENPVEGLAYLVKIL
jgi:ribosomal protein S18 acetylase RimI-like enzyme